MHSTHEPPYSPPARHCAACFRPKLRFCFGRVRCNADPNEHSGHWDSQHRKLVRPVEEAAPPTPPKEKPSRPPPVEHPCPPPPKPTPTPPGTQPLHDYSRAVILQAFGWDSWKSKSWYRAVAEKAEAIHAAGVTHVWLPPPSQSVSPQGYLPGQLYNLNSKYGTKEELVQLTRTLKDAGLKPMADIVINHRCADEVGEGGVYNRYRDDVTHKGHKIDWGRWAITCDDPRFRGTGHRDTGADFPPAPDLDHANPELRAALKDWLAHLQQDVGFEGWRLDFVKGYDAKYAAEYIESTTGPKELNVGEYWVSMRYGPGGGLETNQDAARQQLVDWLHEARASCCLFDFPTKGILQEAMKRDECWRLKDNQGKAPGLLGWWPSKAVTFIDNHDTGSSQQHWPFPPQLVGAGYAYILTHPGMPCILWEHLFSWGNELQANITHLVQVREALQIHARSKLDILAAEHDLYVACVDDKLTVKIGSRYDIGSHLLPSAAEGWKLEASGNEWAVWVKH